MRDLAALPKAHLHLHLDGALRESTLNELCEQRGVEHPPLPGGSFESFDAFMDTIAACHDALSFPDSLRRVVHEVMDDAAADGAVWVEISLWPGLFGGRLGPDRQAIQIVLDAGREAAKGSGVGFGVMVAANRHQGPAAAIATATLAVELGSEGVVSFGLDGDEAAFPPSPFTEAFEIAKMGGLLCTPHAGELLGPRSVADALDLLHADRILHGVRAIEDEELLIRLASSQVCLDVCPTSNAKLRVFTLEDHPLPALLDRGIKCTINADDPLLFGTTLGDEYEICRTQFSLSDEALATIAKCSIEFSGAPSELKRSAVGEVRRWFESHDEQ
jgi:adenosine deaminase